MIVVYTDGTSFDVPNPDLSLEVLQALVGGYIEFVSLRDGSALVVNEEGLLLGLEPNPTATAIAVTKGMPVRIVGTALFLSRREVQESDDQG